MEEKEVEKYALLKKEINYSDYTTIESINYKYIYICNSLNELQNKIKNELIDKDGDFKNSSYKIIISESLNKDWSYTKLVIGKIKNEQIVELKEEYKKIKEINELKRLFYKYVNEPDIVLDYDDFILGKILETLTDSRLIDFLEAKKEKTNKKIKHLTVDDLIDALERAKKII